MYEKKSYGNKFFLSWIVVPKFLLQFQYIRRTLVEMVNNEKCMKEYCHDFRYGGLIRNQELKKIKKIRDCNELVSQCNYHYVLIKEWCKGVHQKLHFAYREEGPNCLKRVSKK